MAKEYHSTVTTAMAVLLKLETVITRGDQNTRPRDCYDRSNGDPDSNRGDNTEEERGLRLAAPEEAVEGIKKYRDGKKSSEKGTKMSLRRKRYNISFASAQFIEEPMKIKKPPILCLGRISMHLS